MSEMLKKARAYEAEKAAQTDKNTRPLFHISAPAGWINDPNGFSVYDGKIHLFYQYYPYAREWGPMHWGHSVTTDMISWEQLPAALAPDQDYDRNGCFSGSAIEEDGKMQLYYTGVNYLTENPEDINLCVDEHFVSAQLMITSEDGIHFDNIKDKKTVIPVIHDADIGDARHTRDPKVWKDGDRWYMVLGSTINDKQGKLLFFTSTDGEEWKFENSVTRENFGWMWECPDYFEVDNSQVVIFSPMQLFKDGKAEDAQTVCMQVTFDKETCDMKLPEKYQFLDYGTDLYAPQSTLDESGRRILTAWLRMPEPDGKWQGMMCIPRVVEVQKDHIYFRVHPNVQAVYTKEISEPSEADESGYRLRFSLEDGDKVNVGGYVISREGNKICTDRSALFEKFPNHRVKFETPELKDGFEIEAYVNPNQISVFVNNGEAVITNTVYDLKKEINTNVKVKIETL